MYCLRRHGSVFTIVERIVEMKRIKLCVLAFMLLLTSCGGETALPEETSETTTTASTETEPVDPYSDDLPRDLDFEGREFRVLTYLNGNLPSDSGSWPNYIDVDEQNGDLVNDAAYERNLTVEERLGVKITCTESSGFNVVGTLSTSILAQEDEYDLALIFSTENCVNLIMQNMLVDVNTTEYIDLSKPYYTQSATETYRLGDANYIFAGKYPYPQVPSVFLIINKGEWENLGLEDPYQLVRDGKWTHDKMMSVMKDSYRDLNGNNERDADDFYGLQTIPIVCQYLYTSYGGKTVTPTDSGFEFGFGDERAVNIIENIIAVLSDSSTYKSPETGGIERYQTFFDGHALMTLYGSSFHALRDIEFDYGLLPTPKLDESQEDYRTYLAGGICMIPVTVSDTAFVSAVTEALYSESAKRIEEPFIQQFVENKLLRDEGSVEMYRLMCDTACYELTRYLDLSGGLIANLKPIGDLISRNSTDIMSSWASVKDAVETKFNEFYDAMVAGK